MKRGPDGRFLKASASTPRKRKRGKVAVRKAAPRKRKVAAARKRKPAARPRENPPGLALMVMGNPPPVAEEILGELHQLRYRHAETGVDHVHDFGPGARVVCMSDGSLWIRNPRRRLWKEF